ncbi:conserved Plasmodium protein, unknown function [Plasmodium gallinaceum]|uniref:Uncharacterized protein n=1 Tax=Plasmodium gallinaceum TaxID=5849 RepID=A0A1J1GN41_PLAGA|nr:conserved Plasmodium protein, unknown function [Plasmodium gallinaceum]CRG93881.1 conserved Plasmodium protein, unknown function [Plasmodium gallinaceum]
MKKVVKVSFLVVVFYMFLLLQKVTICTYIDITHFSEDLIDNIMKSEIYMSNHLKFNENNKSNKRKKRNESDIDDINLLTSMLSQIIPYNFSFYSITIPDGNIDSFNSDTNNFLDLVNIYDPDINNTITHHLNKTQPIKGCENDIKNYNCDKDVIKCITLNKKDLSESCKKSLNNSLLYSCIDDFLLYCIDYSKFSKVYKCLKENFFQLSNKCLNILSYYENIMQKLHKMKSKPYDNEEFIFFEKDKINFSDSKNNIDSTNNLKKNSESNENNNKQNILHSSNKQKLDISDNLRKEYSHYILPSMNYHYLGHIRPKNYFYKYILYFFEFLFILFVVYVIIIYIKKYYVMDSNKFYIIKEKKKLAKI